MPIDLIAVLPAVLPRAISWVNAQAAAILQHGEPLSATGLRLAGAVGVSMPERVRVRTVSEIPLPEDLLLRAVALETGLLGPRMIGVTFGYGIFLRAGYVDNRLISHECRHVYQYEQAGSIENFLPAYLQQIATHGYDAAPFEVDARLHEIEAI